MRVVDEPTGQIHELVDLASSPDPQRPGWQDVRVWVARCGKVIALVGYPEHRPPEPTPCSGCFPLT